MNLTAFYSLKDMHPKVSEMNCIMWQLFVTLYQWNTKEPEQETEWTSGTDIGCLCTPNQSQSQHPLWRGQQSPTMSQYMTGETSLSGHLLKSDRGCHRRPCDGLVWTLAKTDSRGEKHRSIYRHEQHQNMAETRSRDAADYVSESEKFLELHLH